MRLYAMILIEIQVIVMFPLFWSRFLFILVIFFWYYVKCTFTMIYIKMHVG